MNNSADDALREWEDEVSKISTPEEREEFLKHIKDATTLSSYTQAIAKHIKDNNKNSKSIRVAKWIRPVLEGLNIIVPVVLDSTPVDPRVLSIVPGAIANVLAVSSKYVEYQEKLEWKISELASKLDFAKQYGEHIFPKSLELRKSLIRLYLVIFGFCVSASRLFITAQGTKRATIKRVARSAWATFEKDFEEYTIEFNRRYDDFQYATNICRDEAIADIHQKQLALTDMMHQRMITLEKDSRADRERAILQSIETQRTVKSM
jgi:hypothetical protein